MANGGVPAAYENDKKMMAGAHAIMGFVDIAQLFSSPKGYYHTHDIAWRLEGMYDGYYYTWNDAWNYTNRAYETAGTRLRNFFGNNCVGDHLPGYGTYRSDDPGPYPSDSIYEVNFTC